MLKYFKTGKVVFWAGLIIIIFMFVKLASETSKNYQLRSKSDELQGRITNLEGQIDDLNNRITYYKTDAFREVLARQKLNVAANGESVIIIKDEKNKPKEAQADQVVVSANVQDNSKLPNYQQWWNFLFGN
jgi:cell division protein FtsB